MGGSFLEELDAALADRDAQLAPRAPAPAPVDEPAHASFLDELDHHLAARGLPATAPTMDVAAPEVPPTAPLQTRPDHPTPPLPGGTMPRLPEPAAAPEVTPPAEVGNAGVVPLPPAAPISREAELSRAGPPSFSGADLSFLNLPEGASEPETPEERRTALLDAVRRAPLGSPERRSALTQLSRMPGGDGADVSAGDIAKTFTAVPGAAARGAIGAMSAPFVGVDDPDTGGHLPGLFDLTTKPLEKALFAQPLPENEGADVGWQTRPNGSTYYYQPPNEEFRHPLTDSAEAVMAAPFVPFEAVKKRLPDTPLGDAGRDLVDVASVLVPAKLHGALDAEHPNPLTPEKVQLHQNILDAGGRPVPEAPPAFEAPNFPQLRGVDAPSEPAGWLKLPEVDPAQERLAAGYNDANPDQRTPAQREADLLNESVGALDAAHARDFMAADRARPDPGQAMAENVVQEQLRAANEAARAERARRFAEKAGEVDADALPRSVAERSPDPTPTNATRYPSWALNLDQPHETTAGEWDGSRGPMGDGGRAEGMPLREMPPQPEEIQAREAARAVAEPDMAGVVLPGLPEVAPAAQRAKVEARSAPTEGRTKAVEPPEAPARTGAEGLPGMPVEEKAAPAKRPEYTGSMTMPKGPTAADYGLTDRQARANMEEFKNRPSVFSPAKPKATFDLTHEVAAGSRADTVEALGAMQNLPTNTRDALIASAETMQKNAGSSERLEILREGERLNDHYANQPAPRQYTPEERAAIESGGPEPASLPRVSPPRMNKTPKSAFTPEGKAKALKILDGAMEELKAPGEDFPSREPTTPTVAIDLGEEGRYEIKNDFDALKEARRKLERGSVHFATLAGGTVGGIAGGAAGAAVGGPAGAAVGGALGWGVGAAAGSGALGRGLRGAGKFYAERVAPAIERAIGLDVTRHRDVRNIDAPVAAGLELNDTALYYRAAKGREILQDIVGDLDTDKSYAVQARANDRPLSQSDLAYLMADEQSRENLRVNHPEQYQQAAGDQTITEALRNYKAVDQELTDIRERNGAKNITGDYLRRTYGPDVIASKTPEAKTAYDRTIKARKMNSKGREASPEWNYEHSAHDWEDAFLGKYIGTHLIDLKNKIVGDFAKNATPVDGPLPDTIQYNGKTYHSKEAFANLTPAEQKTAKKFDVYDPNAGDKADTADALKRVRKVGKKLADAHEAYEMDKTQANHFALEDAQKEYAAVEGQELHKAIPKPKLLGPEAITSKLKDVGKPEAADTWKNWEAVRLYFQKTTVGLKGPVGHILNVERRMMQIGGDLGVADPRGWAQAWKVAYDKGGELANRARSGSRDAAVNSMMENGAWTPQQMRAVEDFRGGNLNPANWPERGHQLLFGEGGFDQRARIAVYDFLKENRPDLSEREISEHVRTAVGDYNRANWTDLQRSVGRFMLFPGWDFSSARWFVQHPIKTTLPPAIILWVANRALNKIGANRDEDKNDISRLNVFDRHYQSPAFNESMGNAFGAGVVRNVGQSLLNGDNATKTWEGATQGLKQMGGRVAGMAVPPIQAGYELATGTRIHGGDIAPSKDRGMPGRLLPSKVAEDYALWGLGKALPPAEFLSEAHGEPTVKGFAASAIGGALGIQNHHNDAEDRLHRNVAGALDVERRIATEKKTNPDAAHADRADPDNQAYASMRAALVKASTDLHEIDEKIARAGKDKERVNRLQERRAHVLERANDLDARLQRRRAEPASMPHLPTQ